MKNQGKFIIGLTGNIGCGKSLVRSMLENLGAKGIDADLLAREVIQPGTDGYQRVLDAFGNITHEPGGPIDRALLGRIVFNEPELLVKLEAIIHPAVIDETRYITKTSNELVIVVEAVKLLETTMAAECDSVWLVTSPKAVQLERLTKLRGMKEADAVQRIEAQTSQDEKAALADVIIVNAGSMDETWEQVVRRWMEVVPKEFRNVKLSDAALNRQLTRREHID